MCFNLKIDYMIFEIYVPVLWRPIYPAAVVLLCVCIEGLVYMYMDIFN